MNFLMVGYNSHIPHLLLSFVDNKSLPNALTITIQEVMPNPVSPCPPRPQNISTFLQSLRSICTIHCLANGFDCTIQICKSYQYALNILKKKQKKTKKNCEMKRFKNPKKTKSVTVISCTWDETVTHSTTLNTMGFKTTNPCTWMKKACLHNMITVLSTFQLKLGPSFNNCAPKLQKCLFTSSLQFKSLQGSLFGTKRNL